MRMVDRYRGVHEKEALMKNLQLLELSKLKTNKRVWHVHLGGAARSPHRNVSQGERQTE
jgi:hypothetical protein